LRLNRVSPVLERLTAQTLYEHTELQKENWVRPGRVSRQPSSVQTAWGIGLLPNADLVAEIRRPGWREAIDACRMLTSPVHHLLRRWHSLEPLPYLGQELAYIRDDPNLLHV
jgi:hypothetical protein